MWLVQIDNAQNIATTEEYTVLIQNSFASSCQIFFLAPLCERKQDLISFTELLSCFCSRVYSIFNSLGFVSRFLNYKSPRLERESNFFSALRDAKFYLFNGKK